MSEQASAQNSKTHEERNINKDESQIEAKHREEQANVPSMTTHNLPALSHVQFDDFRGCDLGIPLKPPPRPSK
ncbi:unnamed protein product [Caenorhabditis brenneri]